MTDFLLELSRNKNARRVIQALGLPIPLPPVLRRADGGYESRPLAGVPVLFGATSSVLAGALLDALVDAGADVAHAGSEASRIELDRHAAERGVSLRRSLDVDEPFGALVFDASTLSSPAALHELWAFFHPVVRRLQKCGRVVVVGRPPEECATPASAAAQAALDGFVRSLGKELGKRGSTANLLVVSDGAEDRCAGPLRFLLSPHSAYVSGQPLRVVAKGTFTQGSFVRPLDGKTALVTGAARGIGAETARVLAREGAKVICLDRPAELEAAKATAAAIGGEAAGIDLGTPDASDAVAALATSHGGFDIVVHNAGVTRDKTLANMKAEQWDLTLAVNLGAVERVTERLVDDKLINTGGRVIFLSSTSGLSGNMGQTNYAASKAGVIGLARALAPKLVRRGITVNAIAPGFIETQMTAAMPKAIREVARRLNSLSQGGQPVDVGEAVTFLATPNAAGISGQVLRVCGQALVGA